MIWIVIFTALAVAGLVALGVGVFLLAQKAGDTRHEVEVTVGRMRQIAALLGQVELPRRGRD